MVAGEVHMLLPRTVEVYMHFVAGNLDRYPKWLEAHLNLAYCDEK
jgi:hypothetical protein